MAETPITQMRIPLPVRDRLDAEVEKRKAYDSSMNRTKLVTETLELRFPAEEDNPFLGGDE